MTQPELARYLEEIGRRLEEHLGEALVGAYLHGSAAMGAFVPSRSDVDILVVVNRSISPSTKEAIADALFVLDCPGVGLELSVVTTDALERPSDAPAFELHLDAHETHPARLIDGGGRDGDPDLVAQLAMARAHGVALLGPEPASVLPPFDRSLVLRTFVDDLSWGLEHGHMGYAVLNACRTLRFAREGVLSSKPEGGEWAIAQGLDDRATIEAALRRQSGGEEEVDEAEAAALVDRVRREIQSTIGGGSW